MSTTAMPYRPRVGTLPARVIDWLKANPGEELSAADIGLKWSAAPSTVVAGLDTAVKNRGLVLVRNSDHAMVYRLPADTATAVQAQATAWPAPAAILANARAASAATIAHARADLAEIARKTGGRTETVAVTPEEIAALQVEHDVPIAPATSRRAGASKWAPLVAKLGKPGDSVEFPEAWRGPVAAHVSKLNTDARKAGQPQQYVVRATTPGKARIWRKS